MKKLFFGLLQLVLAASIFAQTGPAGTIQPLTIGDTVPDIVFESMINYGAEKARLSDFRGKAVILDFWNKGCASCIKAFPKMQRLQRQFDSELQVLLVTSDPKEEIMKLFKRSEIVRNTSLPMVTGHRRLRVLLPHNGEPYLVWLDKHHVVRHTSSGYNATPENLSAFLQGRPVQFADRHDNMDARLSSGNSILDAENRVSVSNIQYSSIITGRLVEYGRSTLGVLRDSLSEQTIGFRCTNMPIIFLYQVAFKFPHKDRVILEVPNPERYLEPDDPNLLQKWKLKNTYCYELRKLPVFESQTLYGIMQEDLNRYFNLDAVVERRMVRCLVLTKRDSIPAGQLELTSDPSVPKLYEKAQDRYLFKNVPVEALLKSIRDEIGKVRQIPLLNETSIKGNISMILSVRSFKSVESLRIELYKYGLDLIETYREIEVMILKE